MLKKTAILSLLSLISKPRFLAGIFCITVLILPGVRLYTDLLNSDSRVVQTVLVGLILTGFLQTAGFLKKMLTLKLRKKRLAS